MKMIQIVFWKKKEWIIKIHFQYNFMEFFFISNEFEMNLNIIRISHVINWEDSTS